MSELSPMDIISAFRICHAAEYKGCVGCHLLHRECDECVNLELIAAEVFEKILNENENLKKELEK